MKITVTQKHIDRGIHNNPMHCPLAIAINEQCPTYESVVYGVSTGIELISLLDGSVTSVELPWIAMQFIVQYEDGRLEKKRWWNRMKPREYVFEIALPEPVVTKPLKSTSALERDPCMTPQLPPKNLWPRLS